MHSLVDSILRHPLRYLLTSLLLGLVCLPGMLQMKQEFTYRRWFNPQDPILLGEDKFQKEFGSIEALNILLVYSDSVFAHTEEIASITEQLYELPFSARVDSITNTNVTYALEDDIIIEELLNGDPIDQVKMRARDDIIVKDNYLFDQERSTLITFRFNRKRGVLGFYNQVLDATQNVLENNPGYESFHLLGNPKITTSFRKSAMADLRILVPVLLSLIALLIFVQFRNFKIVFISFCSIILSIIIMLGISGYFGFTFNNLTSVAPELVLAIGLADAIHILATFGFNLKLKNTHEALKYSLIKNFIPTIITSLTTAVGFISFLVSDVEYIVDLGYIAALGTIIAWFVTYFFLSPWTLLWVKELNPKQYNFKFDANSLILFLLRNKKKFYLGYSLLFVIAVGLFSQIEVNSDPLNYFRGELDFGKDIKVAEEKMKGVFPLELVFDSGQVDGVKSPKFLHQVQSYIDWVYQSNIVFQDISVIKILKTMNKVFQQNDPKFFTIPKTQTEVAQILFTYNLSVPEGKNLNDRVTLDHKRMRVTFMTKHMDSKSGNQFYELLSQEAKKRNLNMTIAGKRYLWQSLNQKVVYSFIKSLGLALALVTLLLIFFMRSLRLGLISMIPNIIPIVAGSIFLTLLERPLDIGSSIVASIVLGIAVDDTIHVIANYKKYLIETNSSQAALIKLFSETAPALVITTLILSISFACFILASFVPNQNMGILMSLSLLFALLCDLTLLPLILSDLVKSKDCL